MLCKKLQANDRLLLAKETLKTLSLNFIKISCTVKKSVNMQNTRIEKKIKIE